MAYEICSRCGKMFPKNGKSYCEDCNVKTEKELDLIIEYIRRNPDATIIEIISETGVTLKTINCLVNEGNISYVNNSLEKIEDEEILNKVDKILAKKNDFYTKRNSDY